MTFLEGEYQMANNFFENAGNPRARKLRSFNQPVDINYAATYKGVAMKTVYFVLVMCAGIAAFFYMDAFYTSRNGAEAALEMEAVVFYVLLIVTLIASLIAAFAPKTVPVTGSIYAGGMGFCLSLVSMLYAQEFKGIIVEALVLTILTVGCLTLLYSKGVRVGGRLKTACITALFVSIIGGGIYGLVAIIAPNSPIISSINAINNGPIGIVFAAIGVFIAAILLMCDFDTVTETVENGLPEEYEWYASYALIVGVIYLYLKILRLLAKIQGNRR